MASNSTLSPFSNSKIEVISVPLTKTFPTPEVVTERIYFSGAIGFSPPCSSSSPPQEAIIITENRIENIFNNFFICLLFIVGLISLLLISPMYD